MARIEKCSYDVCQLPENNNKYWCQVAYVIFGAICLVFNAEQFSFFPIFAFIAPLLMDLIFGKIGAKKHKIFSYLRVILIVLNVSVIVFCLSGLNGAFLDNGFAFEVSASSLVLPGAVITKDVFLCIMVVDVGVPALYAAASPCKAKAYLPQIAQSAK